MSNILVDIAGEMPWLLNTNTWANCPPEEEGVMMGAGKSGLYKGTYGSNAVPGSIDYMSPTDAFSKNISHRKDIDVNGFLLLTN